MQLPTALQTDSEVFFVFTKEGASVHPTTSRGVQFPPDTWALADSNEMINQPCGAFLMASLKNVWVVQASSPLKKRWREWTKQRDASIYIMEVFPSDELHVLGLVRSIFSVSLVLPCYQRDSWPRYQRAHVIS
jgi:hypothetical protein